MIGFGSVGRGMLPLIERHFEYDADRLTIIDPDAKHQAYLEERGIRFLNIAITKDNYREVLSGQLAGGGQGFCVNLSVETSSLDIMKLCREIGALYIDTVVEPWAGYDEENKDDTEKRTNYVLRETVRAEKRRNPGGTTAVSCAGANPGMVSWFVKAALLDIARDTGLTVDKPRTRSEWAKLMQRVGIKGIHIAERDTQQSSSVRPMGVFTNTWSVDGFIAEAIQPAELGWGTHEKQLPAKAHRFEKGCQAAIWIDRPGAQSLVYSWCPTPGPQQGFLITHNEAISIADYYTVGKGQNPEYRPTCHYAYRPCDDALLSVHDALGSGQEPTTQRILDENAIHSGMDELGVLLFGHAKNAYWYGSRLTIEQARSLAPFQNATALQVTSAVLAGMVWALENPRAGIVETDEMDHERCLEIQTPYLGSVEGHYTDWTPLVRDDLFLSDADESDPWQFKNILVS